MRLLGRQRLGVAMALVILFCLSLAQLATTQGPESGESFPSARGGLIERRQRSKEDVDSLVNLLFPNRTKEDDDEFVSDLNLRRLQITKVPYNATVGVTCVVCKAMKMCSVLNGFLVQEVYYPKNPARTETCKLIDNFADRISKAVFGNGKTFRDTPQCRDIVMQYLCLYYGTDNEMYTNYCVYQEKTDPVNNLNQLARRPPCHSFCVQVASICANEPDYFIHTCSRIVCPYPNDKTCTADPVLKGLPLESNLGCSVPYYDSPYFRAAAAGMWRPGAGLVATGLISISMIFLLF